MTTWFKKERNLEKNLNDLIAKKNKQFIERLVDYRRNKINHYLNGKNMGLAKLIKDQKKFLVYENIINEPNNDINWSNKPKQLNIEQAVKVKDIPFMNKLTKDLRFRTLEFKPIQIINQDYQGFNSKNYLDQLMIRIMVV